jgi:hypothetical protein
VFKEDWGEQLVGVHVTVLVVLDTEKDEVRVLDGIPDNISPGQVMRITNIESAVDNYTRKNLASCSKSANKLCSHCLSQVVNKYGTTC